MGSQPADPMDVSPQVPPSLDEKPASAGPKLAERSVRGLGEWATFPMHLEPGDHEVRLHLRDGTPGTLLRLVLEPADQPELAEPIGVIELEGAAVGRRTWSLPKVHVELSGKHTLRVEVLGPACEIERADMLPLHRRPPAPVSVPVKAAASHAPPQAPSFAGPEPTIATPPRSNPFDPGDPSVTYPADADMFERNADHNADHGEAVGWCVGGEWFEQSVDLPAGTYDIAIHAAAPTGGVDVDVLLNGAVLGTLVLHATDSFTHHRINLLRHVRLDTDLRGTLRIEINGAACDVADILIESAGMFDAEVAADAGSAEKETAEVVVEVEGVAGELGHSAFDLIADHDADELDDSNAFDDATALLGVVDADFDRIGEPFGQDADALGADDENEAVVDVTTTQASEHDDEQSEEQKVNRDMAEALLAVADTLLPPPRLAAEPFVREPQEEEEPLVAEEPEPRAAVEAEPAATDSDVIAIDELAQNYGLELEEETTDIDWVGPTSVEPVSETLAPTGLAQIAEMPDSARTVSIRRRDAGSGWAMNYVRGTDDPWFEGELKPMGLRGGKWSALSASATADELIATAWPQVGASPVASWANDGTTPLAVDIAGDLTLDWYKVGNVRLANPALIADVAVSVVTKAGATRNCFIKTAIEKPSRTWQRETLRLEFAGQSLELMPGDRVMLGLRVRGADAPEFAVSLHDDLVLEVTPLSA